MNEVLVPASKMGGWLAVNWRKIERRVERSERRSQKARQRADRIERGLARSFSAKVYLWRQQDGQCPYCAQAITWATGWSVHHIIPKSQGGSDSLANLQLLHPDCHRQLHAESPTVLPTAEQQLEPAALCR